MSSIKLWEVVIAIATIVYMAFLSFNILSIPLIFAEIIGTKVTGSTSLAVAISIFLFAANGFMLYLSSSYLKNMFDTIKQRGKKDVEEATSAQ